MDARCGNETEYWCMRLLRPARGDRWWINHPSEHFTPADTAVHFLYHPTGRSREAPCHRRKCLPWFPVNKTIIYPEYRRNTAELAKIRATIDSVRNDDKTTLSSIRIHGYASPEGSYANNTRLAKGRTQALVDYVTSYYKFDTKLITSEYTSEDWDGFRKFIVASSLEKKDDILKLMDDSTLDIDKKERQICPIGRSANL